MNQESSLKYFIILLFTSILLFAGCERKTDEAQQPADTLLTDTTKADTTADTSQVMNLQGKWEGTLDQRTSVFNITEFKDNKIKGNILTHARGAVSQQVEGTYIPESRTFRLSDQTRSRKMGNYSGTISEDGNTLSGTFTSNDKSLTSNFSYKKSK